MQIGFAAQGRFRGKPRGLDFVQLPQADAAVGQASGGARPSSLLIPRRTSSADYTSPVRLSSTAPSLPSSIEVADHVLRQCIERQPAVHPRAGRPLEQLPTGSAVPEGLTPVKKAVCFLGNDVHVLQMTAISLPLFAWSSSTTRASKLSGTY